MRYGRLAWAVVVLLVSTAKCGAEPVPGALSAAELVEGWVQLFDGESLFGWKAEGKADWRVRDGAIEVTAGDVGLLRTTAQFADFVLRAEYRCDPATNSGIFVRTSPQPKDPARDCYEINIAPRDNPFPTGSLVKRKQSATTEPNANWRAIEIKAEKGHIEVRLNDALVMEYDDPRPLGRGFVGLQHNQGAVAFRNIRLRPLGLTALSGGSDPATWQAYPQMAGKFTHTAEGNLRVTGGPGQLESRERYGDFVLQLQAITHGDHLNSGVFFRCIPGDKLMGYESQIHNGYHDGDRSRPVDAGTGAIFRRQAARKVMSDDHQWFHKTIVAVGNHISVWVNGCLVTDWTDPRPPHDNPRKGLRLPPGTIMLQGHDPTTDIEFRQLRVAELAPRER